VTKGKFNSLSFDSRNCIVQLITNGLREYNDLPLRLWGSLVVPRYQ
jgi:hypothetical protein